MKYSGDVLKRNIIREGKDCEFQDFVNIYTRRTSTNERLDSCIIILGRDIALIILRYSPFICTCANNFPDIKLGLL